MIVNACSQNFDLELTKSVNPDTIYQGQEFTYTLKIVNHGPGSTNEFTLWDAVPDLITPVKFTIEPTSPLHADTLHWQFEGLAQHDSIIIGITAIITTSIELPEQQNRIVNVSLVTAENDTNDVNDFASSTVVCLPPSQNDCIVLDQNVFEPDRGTPLKITFELSSSSHVRINLYDISGEQITNFVDRIYSEGQYILQWNGMTEKGQKVGSGVYIIIFRTTEFSCVEKIIIAR